jgi:hypothetical protein
MERGMGLPASASTAASCGLTYIRMLTQRGTKSTPWRRDCRSTGASQDRQDEAKWLSASLSAVLVCTDCAIMTCLTTVLAAGRPHLHHRRSRSEKERRAREVLDGGRSPIDPRLNAMMTGVGNIWTHGTVAAA